MVAALQWLLLVAARPSLPPMSAFHMVLAAAMGSLIDLDHFAAARSLNLVVNRYTP